MVSYITYDPGINFADTNKDVTPRHPVAFPFLHVLVSSHCCSPQLEAVPPLCLIFLTASSLKMVH